MCARTHLQHTHTHTHTRPLHRHRHGHEHAKTCTQRRAAHAPSHLNIVTYTTITSPSEHTPQATPGGLIKNWLCSYLGNSVGPILIMLAVYHSNVWAGNMSVMGCCCWMGWSCCCCWKSSLMRDVGHRCDLLWPAACRHLLVSPGFAFLEVSG